MNGTRLLTGLEWKKTSVFYSHRDGSRLPKSVTAQNAQRSLSEAGELFWNGTTMKYMEVMRICNASSLKFDFESKSVTGSDCCLAGQGQLF